MKKFARILAVTLILITITVSALSLTACNKTLTAEESREILDKGIEAAVASETYYVKYRINDMSSDNGKYVQYNLNLQGQTAKFTKASGDILKTVYEDMFYGKSLNDKVASKDATDADYLTGMLTAVDGKWNIEECTLEEFLTDPRVVDYNIDSIAALISGLTDEEFVISSAYTMGKVTYITAKVNKEGNKLAAYDSLTIRVVNGKLAYICDAKETFSISIAYGGPKITLPAWSTTENKGE